MDSAGRESDGSLDHLINPGNQLGLQLGGQSAAEHEEAAKGDDLNANQVSTGVLDDISDIVSGSLIAIYQQSYVVSTGLVQLGAEAANLVGQLTLSGETQNDDALLVAGILGGKLAAGCIDGQLVFVSDGLSKLTHALLLGIVQNSHLNSHNN